jgi:hypothetical protein
VPDSQGVVSLKPINRKGLACENLRNDCVKLPTSSCGGSPQLRRLRGYDGNIDYQCMFGLIASPDRSVVIGEMQRLIQDPDHPVSSLFMQTLSALMSTPNQSDDQLAEDETNRQINHNRLLAAVQHKRGKALAMTLSTVVEAGSYEPGGPKPVSQQISAQIAAVFDKLPIEKQKDMLESRWESIKGLLDCNSEFDCAFSLTPNFSWVFWIRLGSQPFQRFCPLWMWRNC